MSKLRNSARYSNVLFTDSQMRVCLINKQTNNNYFVVLFLWPVSFLSSLIFSWFLAIDFVILSHKVNLTMLSFRCFALTSLFFMLVLVVFIACHLVLHLLAPSTPVQKFNLKLNKQTDLSHDYTTTDAQLTDVFQHSFDYLDFSTRNLHKQDINIRFTFLYYKWLIYLNNYHKQPIKLNHILYRQIKSIETLYVFNNFGK